MDRETLGLLLGFLGVALGLAGIGANMTGRLNRLLGNAFLVLGLLGSIAAFAWAFWPVGYIFVCWSLLGSLAACAIYFLPELSQLGRRKLLSTSWAQNTIAAEIAEKQRGLDAKVGLFRQLVEDKEREIKQLSEEVACLEARLPAPDEPDDTPATDSAGVQQINKIYGHREAIQSCYRFLNRLCVRVGNDNEEGAYSARKRMAELIERFVLPPLQSALELWDQSMGAVRGKSRLNRTEIGQIINAANQAIACCGLALEWIEKAGVAIVGEEELRTTPEYLELRASITELHAELQRAKDHPDVFEIARGRNILYRFITS